MKIRIGSRESKLAVIQTEIVIAAIKKYDPSIEVELVTMKTTGDKILDRTLDKVGGKGLFVKELDQGLLNGDLDLTVHSLKDLPMELNPALPLVAVSNREDPRDALILPLDKKEIDFTKPIGSASNRRKIQLETIYPNCVVEPIRGNVHTRLAKLDRGEFGATTLAYAGLLRLNMTERVSYVFPTTEMLPAACQGVIGVQAREGYNIDFLKNFHNPQVMLLSLAERSFVATLDGGCSAPVAAFAEVEQGRLKLTGMYIDSKNQAHKKTVWGQLEDGVALGKDLALELKATYK